MEDKRIIKETVREYDKDGKIVKEVIKEYEYRDYNPVPYDIPSVPAYPWQQPVIYCDCSTQPIVTCVSL